MNGDRGQIDGFAIIGTIIAILVLVLLAPVILWVLGFAFLVSLVVGAVWVVLAIIGSIFDSQTREMDNPPVTSAQAQAAAKWAPITPERAPADWYPDPYAPEHWRYWDGTAWTDNVAPRIYTRGDV